MSSLIDVRTNHYTKGIAVPSYPYISGQGAIVQMFTQLRKGFPTKVDAGYLQRFNIAPANESYVISILRFLGLIDDEGNRREESTEYFYGGDDVFKPGLDRTLRSAYTQVFDEMGDDAVKAAKDDLTNWFRAADKTSALVGQRQASTFQTLTALAGHGNIPNSRTNGAKRSDGSNAVTKKTGIKKSTPPKGIADALPNNNGDGRANLNAPDVGLTVRIEVNLPPGGDADTYDAIFASVAVQLVGGRCRWVEACLG